MNLVKSTAAGGPSYNNNGGHEGGMAGQFDDWYGADITVHYYQGNENPCFTSQEFIEAIRSSFRFLITTNELSAEYRFERILSWTDGRQTLKFAETELYLGRRVSILREAQDGEGRPIGIRTLLYPDIQNQVSKLNCIENWDYSRLFASLKEANVSSGGFLDAVEPTLRRLIAENPRQFVAAINWNIPVNLIPRLEPSTTSHSVSPRQSHFGVGHRSSRGPDTQISRERIDLEDTLARQLAIIKVEIEKGCTTDGIKRKYPDFRLWQEIQDADLLELVRGAPLRPRAYARHLTLIHYGLTSLETLKKDRRKLRKAAERVGDPR
jgi:hypothetical protein